MIATVLLDGTVVIVKSLQETAAIIAELREA